MLGLKKICLSFDSEELANDWIHAIKEVLDPNYSYAGSRIEPSNVVESMSDADLSPGHDSDFYDPGKIPEVPEFDKIKQKYYSGSNPQSLSKSKIDIPFYDPLIKLERKHKKWTDEDSYRYYSGILGAGADFEIFQQFLGAHEDTWQAYSYKNEVQITSK